MISFMMSFFVFSVSFLGYIHPQVMAGKPIGDIIIPFKYKNSGLTDGAEILLKMELERLMKEKEVYLEPISLKQLSDLANSNRHDVSLVINKHFSTNYFEFLNGYRVAYVKVLLLDPANKNTSIIQLAYEAGFSNKVSFNKSFKRITGFRPMAYRATEGQIDIGSSR